MSRRAGFTLLEVLLASTLAAVVGLAVAQLVQVSHRAERAVRTRAEARGVRAAIARRLEADLRAVVPAGGLHASGIIGQSFAGGAGAGAEELLAPDVAARPIVFGPGGDPLAGDDVLQGRDVITLAVLGPPPTWGDTEPVGHGGIWQVLWEIDDDPLTPERGLVRRVQRLRDPLPGSEPEPPEEIAPEAVGLEVRFWDGTAWTDVWDSGASDTLPMAIEARVAVVIAGEPHVVQVLVAPPQARVGAVGTTR
ncbi:MAG: prepilin-type N-terminal cleavage/methylation domain-containing protein [Planctomycetes bacterium]|nr:prepilin-type N-terminal cleavage/methylation domain-containing protein [Planctomycetota bacterium]